MDEKVQELLNNILEMNIQGRFYANYHTLRLEDVGYHHHQGITGTFSDCVIWIIECFKNNNYVPELLEDMLAYLDEWGVPNENVTYIGFINEDGEPDEEYYVYIRKAVED